MASVPGYDYLGKILPLRYFSILCVCVQTNYGKDHLFLLSTTSMPKVLN